MNNITIKMQSALIDLGADLVGFGSLLELPCEMRKGMSIGVSVAVKYPPEIIKQIHAHPTFEYLEWYNTLNRKLDIIVMKGAELLQDLGHQAIPLSRQAMKFSQETFATLLPHKTVATRAGLGWIGKSALLVTKEFGSAVRFSTILTDAPLETKEPINESLCKDCTMCVRTCPGGAVLGENWQVGVPREMLFDAKKCFEKARELCKTHLDKQATICGKCIEICPHTRNYIWK